MDFNTLDQETVNRNFTKFCMYRSFLQLFYNWSFLPRTWTKLKTAWWFKIVKMIIAPVIFLTVVTPAWRTWVVSGVWLVKQCCYFLKSCTCGWYDCGKHYCKGLNIDPATLVSDKVNTRRLMPPILLTSSWILSRNKSACWWWNFAGSICGSTISLAALGDRARPITDFLNRHRFSTWLAC